MNAGPSGGCPNDGTLLLLGERRGFVIRTCAKCSGRLCPVGLLRQDLLPSFLDPLIRQARATAGSSPGKSCPACGRRMTAVSFSRPGRRTTVDVCVACDQVWFDKGESEEAPLREGVDPHLDAARAIARSKAEAHVEMGADSAWQAWVAALGLPVKHGEVRLRGIPWATLATAVACVVVSILVWREGEDAFVRWGFVPSRDGWISGTSLTSFFIHADGWHLAGNLLFLLTFGPHLEKSIGWLRYVAILALATVAGDVAHAATTHMSGAPAIGASGGISGVIAAYAFCFPRTRIGILLPGAWRHGYFQLPVQAALLLWIGKQVFLELQAEVGLAHVAAMAHLGGAGVGVLAGLLWRQQARAGEERERAGDVRVES